MPDADPAYRLAALEALATGGSQAKAALDTQKAAMAQSQQAATSDAMRSAAQYGLGAAGGEALAAPITKAYDASNAVIDKVSAPRLARFDQMRWPTARVFDTKRDVNNARSRGGGGGGGGGGSSAAEVEADPGLPPSPVGRTFFRPNPVTKKVDAQMQKNLGYALGVDQTPSSVRTRLQKEFAGNDQAVTYYYQQYKQAYTTQQAAAAAAKKKKK